LSDDHYRAEIESILRDRLRVVVTDPEGDLLDSGLLDSLGLIDLLVAIETRFGIVIDLGDLDLEDIRTVSAIVNLVRIRLE
jgi:D-alanine--poly(phosphoribitol) ligase subunit 2